MQNAMKALMLDALMPFYSTSLYSSFLVFIFTLLLDAVCLIIYTFEKSCVCISLSFVLFVLLFDLSLVNNIQTYQYHKRQAESQFYPNAHLPTMFMQFRLGQVRLNSTSFKIMLNPPFTLHYNTAKFAKLLHEYFTVLPFLQAGSIL